MERRVYGAESRYHYRDVFHFELFTRRLGAAEAAARLRKDRPAYVSFEYNAKLSPEVIDALADIPVTGLAFFRPTTTPELYRALCAKLPALASLSYLKMWCVDVDGGDGVCQLRPLAEALPRMPSLRALWVGTHNDDAGAITEVMSALAHTNVDELKLYCNTHGLTPAQTAALAAGLPLTKVQRLFLNVAHEATRELGAAACSAGLQSLHVALYAMDVTRLCDALQPATALTDLSLSGSTLCDASVAALCRLVTQNRGLRRLALGNCGIGARWAVELLDAWKKGSVATLDLTDNSIGEDVVADYQAAATAHNREFEYRIPPPVDYCP